MTLLPILKTNARARPFTVAAAIIQEKIRNPAVRKKIAWLTTVHRRRNPEMDSRALSELFDRGVTHFPQFISTEYAERLVKDLSALPCFDPWNRKAGEFSFDAPPDNTHVGQIRLAPTLEPLHELAMDDRVVELVTGYFNAKPYLDSIQAWWSYSGNDTPQEAENFHRDNDGIRFLKFFIYMTDVGEANGPHVFVDGSPRSPVLTRLGRLSDAEVEQAFGKEKILVMRGKAGDAFLEDTFGIHKGQLPQEGRRLLVQFRYATAETQFRSPVVVTRANPKKSSITSLVSQPPE